MPLHTTRRRRPSRQNAFVESLESRRMLSVVDVGRFGAIPNDGRDDSAAIASAVRASLSGDTIKFNAGTYNVGTMIDLPAGLTLDGGGSATIRANDRMFALHFREKGLTIKNITFSGGALFMEPKGGRATGDLVIDSCSFVDFGRGGDVGASYGAIGAPGARVNNLTVTNSTFTSDGRGMGIHIYTGDNWYIANNSFTRVLGSIKSNNSGNQAKNIKIVANYFAYNRRHAVELQGTVNGFWFTDNFYEKPTLSTDRNSNDSTFAFSLIYTAPSFDQHILRNTVIAPERPDGVGVRMAFEAGENGEVRDNYVVGCAYMTQVYGPNTIVSNNRTSNNLYGVGYAYGRGSNTSKFFNNGPNVQLTWDINRPRPGPGVTLPGGDPTPPPSPTPAPVPPPAPAPVPDPALIGSIAILRSYVVDSRTIMLTWTDGYTNEAGYRVERSLDGKKFVPIYDTKAANKTSYIDKNLPAGTQFWYRVVAYKGSSVSNYSNIVAPKTYGIATA